jgi:hypothetical protein
MAVVYLSKQGYGTVSQIRDLDTKDFLDLMEYEAIENAIERHLRWKAENNRG